LVFVGTYEHAIDAKNRLAIPAEIREQLGQSDGLAGYGSAEGGGAGGSGRAKGGGKAGAKSQEKPVYLYVALGEGQALCLYTEQGFEQRAAELDRSELESEELLTYERLMFSLARRVDLDAQGRVRLPENLLKMAEVGTEIVLIGVKDHLEIRNRQAWTQQVARLLAERPGILMNPRRAMRKNSPQG
jgi:MraZ protein